MFYLGVHFSFATFISATKGVVNIARSDTMLVQINGLLRFVRAYEHNTLLLCITVQYVTTAFSLSNWFGLIFCLYWFFLLHGYFDKKDMFVYNGGGASLSTARPII